MKEKSKILLILLFAITLVSCSSDKDTTKQTTITIAAAASLENIFEDKLIKEFEKENDNIKIKGIYDASGKLQTQINEGLNADIFFSAANKQMNELVDQKVISNNNVQTILENNVVLIKAKDTNINITNFNDILKAKKIAVGDPKSVPAGIYAQDVLTSLKLWVKVTAKASYGSNVTEVLNWVSAGSADVGIVYESDAQSDDGVEIVATAPESALKEKVEYPIGIIEKSKNIKEAQLFIDFLKSNKASKTFEKYGFTPINK